MYQYEGANQDDTDLFLDVADELNIGMKSGETERDENAAYELLKTDLEEPTEQNSRSHKRKRNEQLEEVFRGKHMSPLSAPTHF